MFSGEILANPLAIGFHLLLDFRDPLQLAQEQNQMLRAQLAEAVQGFQGNSSLGFFRCSWFCPPTK